MFDITLIVMGKLKEKFYLSAAAEYEKRLKGYCSFRLLELPEHRLPENPSPAEIQAGLDKEAELIFQKVMGVGRMPNAETEKLDPAKLQEAVAQVQAFVEDRMKTFLLSSNKI